MILKEIKKKDKKLVLQIITKNVKNINFRIKDNSILISKPAHISVDHVLELSEKRFDWFYQQQQSLIKRTEQRVRRYNEKQVYIFNQKYLIKYAEINQIIFKDNYIYLPQSNGKKRLDSLLRKMLMQHLLEVRTAYDRILLNRNIPLPEIKVRKMKSRWGSCLVNKNIIHINVSLIHYSKEAINYVLLHEYLHFIEPNHSPKFYQLMERYLPNYQEINKQLKS